MLANPKQLPLIRLGFDHRIPLKKGAKPIDQRPYKYYSAHKTIIDNLVDEMLTQWFIQHNNSPYASFVVLVGENDGSWRLCADY